jgi:hypothetical protein
LRSHNRSEEERVGTIGLRTEECVSSVGDKTARGLCGEAEPEGFCGFLKSPAIKREASSLSLEKCHLTRKRQT